MILFADKRKFKIFFPFKSFIIGSRYFYNSRQLLLFFFISFLLTLCQSFECQYLNKREAAEFELNKNASLLIFIETKGRV